MQIANDILNTPIEYLKLVGSERAKIFRSEFGVDTLYDLLLHFPHRYEDRSQISKISAISEGSAIQLLGKITALNTVPGKKKRLVARFEDETGQMDLVWFRGLGYISKSLQSGKKYLIYGKANKIGSKWSMPHPEMEIYDPSKQHVEKGLVPIYPGTEKANRKGLNSRAIHKIIQENFSKINDHLPDALPDYLLQKLKFPALSQAYQQIHLPTSYAATEKARERFKFEEFFFLQLVMTTRKMLQKSQSKGYVFPQVGDYFNTYYKNHIPFELTDAQKRVIKEIRQDLGSGKQMNRLLQGDVGSGKTMVALLVMLLAIDNGFQTVLMAPTEILAQQHYQFIAEAMFPLGIQVALLTGSVKGKNRSEALAGIESGNTKILIGTHAVIEDKVRFQKLGLAVIDEQHRFGVAQRARLWKKSESPPHVLVMTATPIPRTLSMTMYGDLDISVIDELPPGRKPIKTVHRNDSARSAVFGFLQEEINKGRQVYIVYPLIEESQKMDYKDLMDGYESITRRFSPPDYQVSILHGQMHTDAKEYEMQRFVKGETHIMVATTVIEVGVNVPNASVMVIESAEKFGLSQLHQLRGRIGRGSEQSYCVLMTGEKLSTDARTRLKTMVSTQDGFQIAEVDLQLRGAGDMMGTQQSGTAQLRVADIVQDKQWLFTARDTVEQLLKKDSELNFPEHAALKLKLNALLHKKLTWSKIS